MKTQQRKQPARAFNAQQRQIYSTNLFQTFKGLRKFTSSSLLQKIQERRAAPAARAPPRPLLYKQRARAASSTAEAQFATQGLHQTGGKNIKLPARGPKPCTCKAPQHGDTGAPRAELGQPQDFFKCKQLRLLQLFVTSKNRTLTAPNDGISTSPTKGS